MREIKFRMWDKTGLHGPVHGTPPMSPSMSLALWIHTLGEMHIDLENQPWIVMQFTGLKDKNGREIYEGDIVRLAPCGVEPRMPYEIKWNGTDVRYQLWQKFGFIDFDLLTAGRYEVIGNIYENPEQLTSPTHANGDATA